MLYVVDKVIKLGGVYIGGEVTDVEISEGATIYEAQDDKGKIKSRQPNGYETAKVMVNVLMEDTKSETTIQQITNIQRLFKAYGQTKAKLLSIVNEDCAARGITKVYFKNFTTKKVISESKRIASLELWAPTVAGIKVTKKTSTKKKTTKKASTKKKTTKKTSSKTPAKDNKKTAAAKKAARKVTAKTK